MSYKRTVRHVPPPDHRNQGDPALTPEEAWRAFIGGPRYGEKALAEAVAAGKIPADEIRKIVGVDPEGNLIYLTDTVRAASGKETFNF